ncbi:MAG: uncharacterized protein JWQ37_3159 [Blastococcus sp.]|jgi:hypothetical protein|nr:uncharacterized protein [Blastococcus sp.]
MSDDAAPAPLSAVPRLMRLVCALLGAVVVAVMLYVAAGLKETTNTVVNYRVSDQVAMVGLGLVLAAGILFLGRSRVDADADGIRFRNIALGHALPWTAVRAVAFERKSPWASLILENHDEVALLAIQAVDGERAVAAVEGLRALHAAARARDPQPPPLLY